MKKLAWIVVLALCTAAIADEKKPPATQPVIKVSKETTRILGPLRPDGTVDYLAAINARYSRGVTKENNAAILLIEAFGPEFLPKETRERILKKLDYKVKPGIRRFSAFEGDEKAYDAALEGPWKAKDHPELAKWLKDNVGPLAKIVAASKRERCYIPLFTAESDRIIWDVLFASLVMPRDAARALGIRANLALAESRFKDARNDIIACHRLSTLLGQGPSLLDNLLGLSISDLASEATHVLAASEKFPADESRTMLADLAAAEGYPSIVFSIDACARYLLLDATTRLAQDTKLADRELQRSGILSDDFWKEWREIRDAGGLEDVDWNAILTRTNAFVDAMVVAMRKPTFAERAAVVRKLEKRIDGFEDEAASLLTAPDPGSLPLGKRTKLIGSTVLQWFSAPWSYLLQVVERGKTQRSLAELSLALAAYRAEKGAYPAKLADLSPGYVKVIPNDFFSGKDLIYKPTKDGYLLYSVGPNMKDDDGERDNKKDGKDDIAIRVPLEDD